MERLLRWLIAPQNSGPVLAFMICAYYGGVGWVNPDISDNLVSRDLMRVLAVISAAFLLLGWYVMPGALHRDDVPMAHRAIFRRVATPFILFILFTIVTAPSVPLLDAIRGKNVQDIAVARENFLKAREGLFAVLPYLNGILTFTFVPYVMCLAILNGNRTGWLLLALFLGYSLLFVEKAFFIRVLAPMGALIAVTNTRRIRLSWLLFGVLAILAINIKLSGFADGDRDILEFFLYRLMEVPARTAIDTLTYWRETWGGNLLWGSTNLVLSTVFALDRVQLERLVFEYEFGAFETGTGSANSVFFIDAYVNFGLVGLAITALLAGMVLKRIGRSRDLAIRCLSPLMVYSLFFGSFYSILFGNGLLFFLLLTPAFSYRPRKRGQRNAVAAAEIRPSPVAFVATD